MSNDLVLYDRMCVAIAEAHAVDEVMAIKDRAAAIAAAAKVAKNVEAETKARIIRFRAERRIGELLNEVSVKRKSTGHYGGGSYKSDRRVLADSIGISQQNMVFYTRMAVIPKEIFEKRVRTKKSTRELAGYITLISKETTGKHIQEKIALVHIKTTWSNLSVENQFKFLEWLEKDEIITINVPKAETKTQEYSSTSQREGSIA